MDPHLHGQQPDAFDGRERLFSGQRGRGGVLRPSQAGVLPQAQLRGRLDGRVHQHAQRLHGPVPGQADQDGVRHEHHGSSTRARSCGMIGGDGINDESNKTAPAPTRNTDLTKNSDALAAPVPISIHAPQMGSDRQNGHLRPRYGQNHPFSTLIVSQIVVDVLGTVRKSQKTPAH